ncbi:MAG: hypothetical protein J6N81_11010 [Treponema sp.]|nr:hypothetical protein [Treponema sp.]
MRKIFSIYIFLLEFFCFAEIPEEWGPVIRLKVTQHDKEQLEAVYNEGGYGLWGYTSFPNQEEVRESLNATERILREDIEDLSDFTWLNKVYKNKYFFKDEDGYQHTFEWLVEKINATYDKKIKKASKKKNAAELIDNLEKERKKELEPIKKKFQDYCEIDKYTQRIELVSQLPHHLTVLTNALQFAKEDRARKIAEKKAQEEAEKRAVHIKKNPADVKYSPVEFFPAFSKKAISRIRMLESRSNYYESFADFEVTYSDGSKEVFLNAKLAGTSVHDDILHGAHIFCKAYVKDTGKRVVIIETNEWEAYNWEILDFNAIASDCVEGKSIFTSHFIYTNKANMN